MISPKMLIKICKDFLHEKDRIWDREERRKDTMEVKEPEKENSYFHMTVNGEVYLNWCTLNQSSTKQKKLYFNSMNVEIKLHKNHL